MSAFPPNPSLSAPSADSSQPPSMLPTPSSSSSAPEAMEQLRRDVEQQIADKEKQMQDSRSVTGRSVLARQIKLLKERLWQMDRQQQQQPPPAQKAPLHHRSHTPTATATNGGDAGGAGGAGGDGGVTAAGSSGSGSRSNGGSERSPTTQDKLQRLERDIRGYQKQQQQQLSPTLGGSSHHHHHHHHHRKDKLTGRSTTSPGLDPLPSPSTSTMLPPPQGHDSTSLLPLPPPPTGSTPTKRRSKVPNADRRNTDIEFATEIGQGLLIEVRKMQALLQEKDDQLKALQVQKADLERAAESLAKQLRQKEENEERLKEETWNLELAKQELTISVTQLQQNLHKANAEQKRMAEHLDELTAEIEHMRDREEKLSATIEEMKQRHEHDMATIRRHAANVQREKADHAKQLEALSSELTIAKAQSRIARRSHPDLAKKTSGAVAEKNEEQAQSAAAPAKEGDTAPGTTPPPSPKQAPSTRNQALEVETLKTSLAHAHRLVSNLRSNLHKEKTDKFEFKKLLTEAQERIEQLENDPRLWADYPNKSASSGNGGPDSAAVGPSAGRRLRKAANKRRAPVSKARITTSNTRTSDADDRAAHSRPPAGDTSDDDDDDDEFYSDTDDDDGGGEAPEVAAGFASLESELSKDHQPQPPTLAQEPPSTTQDDTPRSLEDELNAAGGPSSSSSSSSDGGKDHVAKEAAVQTDMVPLDQQNTPGFQANPSDTREQHTQSDIPTAADAATQTAPINTTDQTVQMEPVSVVDKETQCGLSAREPVSEASQCEPTQTTSAAVQTDEQSETKSSNGIAAGLGALAAAVTSGQWTGAGGQRAPDDDETHASKQKSAPNDALDDDGSVGKIEEQHMSRSPDADSTVKELTPGDDDRDNTSRLYSQAQTDEMIAAAVADAVAKVKADMAPPADETPARPSSPPPGHLLDLVNRHEKGKSPALVRPSSKASSLTPSENRTSVGSSAYETASLRTDGQVGLITQTMIGDWMWKYTRKAVGNGLSDRRHQRYFWIHPYTRTLYWSTKAPGTQGSDMKTKSALIESVQAVHDETQPPAPGVPDTSIVVKTDSRVIKFTAPSAAQHQVWLDALTYLVSRGSGSGDSDDGKAAAGGARGSLGTSSNGSVARRSSSMNRLSLPTAAFSQRQQRQRDDDSGDERLEDVRMCCDGKHHVSRLERDTVPQRPFYPKRPSRHTLRHHHHHHHHHNPHHQQQQVPQQVN